MPVIGGDPGAVETAAAELGRAGRDLDDVGMDVRAHGRAVTAAWTGAASDAASDGIDRVGRRVSTGAEAVVAAGPVYLVYAVELRSAQREYAAGEAMVAGGHAQQLGAAAQALRASDRPLADPGRDAAVTAAQQAGARAARVVAEGEQIMAAAVQREAVANEVAARAIRALTDQLREAAAPAGTGASASRDEEPWYRGLQDVADDAVDFAGGLARGAGNVTAAAGQVAWDTGPGAVSGLLRLSPFKSDQEAADAIDGAERWLQQAWGADTESGEYRAAYGGGALAGMVFGGKKIEAAAEGLGEPAKSLVRGGDDAALGAAAKSTDGTAGASATSRSHALTEPSRQPDPSAVPRGSSTRIDHEAMSAELQRSLTRENESARLMSKAGYDVEQNPPRDAQRVSANNLTKPDYRIDGEYFDCYAPTTANVRNIAAKLEFDKMAKEQADRFVVNLDDTSVSTDELADYLRAERIQGLQEVFTVENGTLTRVWP